MDIFVANIPFDTTEPQLKELFEMHGTVEAAKIVTDKDTNKSRGFGFVKMPYRAEAEMAIQELSGSTLGNRNIVVSESQPKNQTGGSRDPRKGGRQYREDGNRR